MDSETKAILLDSLNCVGSVERLPRMRQKRDFLEFAFMMRSCMLTFRDTLWLMKLLKPVSKNLRKQNANWKSCAS